MGKRILFFILSMVLITYALLFFARPVKAIEYKDYEMRETLEWIEARLAFMIRRPEVHPSVDPALPYKDLLRGVTELRKQLEEQNVIIGYERK